MTTIRTQWAGEVDRPSQQASARGAGRFWVAAATALVLLSQPSTAAYSQTAESRDGTADAIRNIAQATEGLVELRADDRSNMSPPTTRDGFEVVRDVSIEYVGQIASREPSDIGSIYRDVEDSTDLVSQALEASSRHLLVLGDETAPTEHRFRVNARGPIELVATAEGGIRVLNRRSGEDLLHIRPPWAEDAHGHAVETYFEIRGTTFIQHVEHRTGDVAYPVVADPHYDCGWVTCTLYFNRNETLLIASFGGYAAVGCATVPFPGSVVCGIAVVSFQGTATYAYSRGGCLKVKHTVGAPNVAWPDTHYGGSYCY